ncbi:baculoviral IAP repeat-containing protein 8-like [Ruditapes philippinarum]|uniref:baculoviral IAP repeat-containing protein 8-like n=1 Tax=Ruditapes philippinarum TaxID=129788 RepID=UPI00295BCA16|nr:baculoviral IAP repeat-containing protein 8-like [Ruditapes philippinarum]
MEYYENRLKTFDTYPKQILPDKYQLARAGFYYTKEADIVVCFRCGVKLSQWEPHDNPSTEHLKWSPNCKYMKMIGPEKQAYLGTGGLFSNVHKYRTSFGFGTNSNSAPSFGFGSETGANLFAPK